MDHVAIMQRSWGLIEKIQQGKKTIESRWYQKRQAPWDRIGRGDRIFFKNSGGLVILQAEVVKVRQFSALTAIQIKGLLKQYAGPLGIIPAEVEAYYQKFQHKKFGILIFLKRVKSIPPFHIDKTGFGMPVAWLTVNNISQIKKVPR